MYIDKRGNLIHIYRLKLDLSKCDDMLVYEYISFITSVSSCSFYDYIIPLILFSITHDDNFSDIRDSIIKEYLEENNNE